MPIKPKGLIQLIAYGVIWLLVKAVLFVPLKLLVIYTKATGRRGMARKVKGWCDANEAS